MNSATELENFWWRWEEAHSQFLESGRLFTEAVFNSSAGLDSRAVPSDASPL
jgi:hypothetical protein